MALKTEKEKTSTEANTAAPEAPAKPQTTTLELALYTNYTWGVHTFEKGKPYTFRQRDALVLLAEHDAGRPVWKIYQPAKPRVAPKNDPIDATMVVAPTQVDFLGDPAAPVNVPGVNTGRRIEVGDDSEIAEVLNQIPGSEDVTV